MSGQPITAPTPPQTRDAAPRTRLIGTLGLRWVRSPLSGGDAAIRLATAGNR